LEYLEIQNLTEFYEDYRVPFADVLKSSCDAKGTPLVDGNNRLSGFAQDVLGKCLSHALYSLLHVCLFMKMVLPLFGSLQRSLVNLGHFLEV
jgi:hypothetical protein